MSIGRIVLSTAIMLSIFFASISCIAAESQSDDSKILAKINKYELTVADFNAETKDKIPANLSPADLEKKKEDLLDNLIMKKLLIQEAQKQNFDKDKAFIREIERYWEQALLKLLYNKRSQELLREISKTESDPGIRDRKVREALNAWMEDLKKRADIKKYKE